MTKLTKWKNVFAFVCLSVCLSVPAVECIWSGSLWFTTLECKLRLWDHSRCIFSMGNLCIPLRLTLKLESLVKEKGRSYINLGLLTLCIKILCTWTLLVCTPWLQEGRHSYIINSCGSSRWRWGYAKRDPELCEWRELWNKSLKISGFPFNIIM